MEIVGLFAAVIGIVTGAWFLWDKFTYRRVRRRSQLKDGWIKELRLEKTPLFSSGESIKFAAKTVIIGNNGSGKTAVTEWLSALSGTDKLSRWLYRTKHLPIIFSVIYEDRSKHTVRIHLNDDAVVFNVDGNDVPESPFPLRVVFVAHKEFSWVGLDDVEIISKHLDLDRATLKNYAENVGKIFYCTINKIEFRRETDGTSVYVDMLGTYPGLGFRMLSKSEQGRVILELGIAMAEFFSRTMPTLLVIERNSFSFGNSLLETYIDCIETNKFVFQTILISTVNDIKRPDWAVAKLMGKPPDVKVLQKF